MTRPPTCSTTRTPRAYGAGSTIARISRPSRPGAWVAFCFLLLAACAPRETRTERVPAPPLPVLCSPVCLVACDADLPRWTGDPDSPRTWDRLGDLVASLRDRIDACEHARAACVQCLRRLDDVGATCGTSVRCGEPR